MAADKGFVRAMLRYAEICENSDEPIKNLNNPAKYYKMAADNGDVKGMKNYDF